MIPVGDSPRTRRTPLVNYAIILANVAVFIWMLTLDTTFLGTPRQQAQAVAAQADSVCYTFLTAPTEIDHFYCRWSLQPREFFDAVRGDAAPVPNPQPRWEILLTIITAMFLHGGWLHIGFNAWALYALGPEAERIYKTGRFLALYFLAGLAGGVASYFFSAAPSVGASGAIFGLIGGLAAFYYVSRELLGEMSRRQLGSLITVVMINLFIGFNSGGLIDNSAHIGGLVGGALAGWLLAPRLAVDERLYPPQVLRRSLALGWPGALALLAVLVFLVMTLNPPIQ